MLHYCVRYSTWRLGLAEPVHGIDGGDTGLNHFLGVDAGVRVDGLTLDIKEILSKHRRPVIDGLAGSVEHTAEHVLGHGGLENVTWLFDRRALFE